MDVKDSPYQKSTNTTGFITANQIAHMHRPEPCQNFHNTRTTIYDAKPLPLVIGNPLPRKDNFITTNQQFQKEKYHEDAYTQPQHPKAPGLNYVSFIKPEFDKRVSRAFRLDPIYDKSETHDQFRAHKRYFDLYEGPKVYITNRQLYILDNKDNVYQFNPSENSVLRSSHPYMTTNLMYHREFTPIELENYALLNAMDAEKKCSDVQIKYRVRPMHDPFEQTLNKLYITPSLDKHRENCELKNTANIRYGFRYPLYIGCPPRTFQPVEHYGCLPTTLDTYGNPNRGYNKEISTHPLKFGVIQPTMSFKGTMKVPGMYTTESQVYGNGRGVDAFVRTERILPTTQPKGL